jgi:hypothetical protein
MHIWSCSSWSEIKKFDMYSGHGCPSELEQWRRLSRTFNINTLLWEKCTVRLRHIRMWRKRNVRMWRIQWTFNSTQCKRNLFTCSFHPYNHPYRPRRFECNNPFRKIYSGLFGAAAGYISSQRKRNLRQASPHHFCPLRRLIYITRPDKTSCRMDFNFNFGTDSMLHSNRLGMDDYRWKEHWGAREI